MATKNFDVTVFQEMNVDELSKINKALVAMIKLKRSMIGEVKKSKLEVGSTVYINSPKFKGEQFIVEKINIKKAQLKRMVNNVVYNVPLSMIEI